PGRESRVAPKRIDGAKHLQKGFLRKVFCVCCVFCHLQANRIYPLLVELKERGKGLLITLLSTLDNAAVGIAPAHFLLHRNHVRCCRGNYASSHCSLL